MNNRFDKALHHVNNITLEKIDDTFRKSNGILGKEYIRRAALFLQHVSTDHKYPFFRAADILGGDHIVDLSRACPKLTKLQSRDPKIMCKYYIEWAALADEGVPIALQFEDLYEPAIKLIERGVRILMRHQFFEIGTGNSIDLSKGIRTYATQGPFNISNSTLESYDQV